MIKGIKNDSGNQQAIAGAHLAGDGFGFHAHWCVQWAKENDTRFLLRYHFLLLGMGWNSSTGLV